MKKPPRKSSSSQLLPARPDDLSSQLVHSSHPLRGDEAGRGSEDDHTEEMSSTRDGTSYKRYGVIVPCPNCGAVQYKVGPLGLPQRECHACGYVFTPEIKQIDKVEDVVEWWKAQAKYDWGGTIKELVEGLAAGRPLKLTIATVSALPGPEQIKGTKRCPDGHVCMHEPSGSFVCCSDPSDSSKSSAPFGNPQSEEEGDSSDASTR